MDRNHTSKAWDDEIDLPAVWRECLRIAKPGATLMVFDESGAQHRLICDIEDAGWILVKCTSRAEG